jgi:hypothetical protein
MRAKARVLCFAVVPAAVVAVAGAAGAPAAKACGGTYPTSTGETVRVTVSDRYPVDEGLARGWAEYVASLLHGPEIARVTLHLASFNEVQFVCGLDALACYNFQRELITAPRDDIPDGPSAQAIVAHEYGHHITRNRLNPPWDPLTHGTKRWASRIGVCAGVGAGRLFPGGLGPRYRLDPGEVFAESYRLLNELRAGRPETTWDIVDASLRPNAAALAALEQDVVDPWTRPTVERRSSSFRPRGTATRSFPLATSLDGRLVITLRAPAKMRLRVTLYDTRRKKILATGGRRLQANVCGHRSLSVRVSRQAGAGRFSLSVSKP